MDFTFRVLSAFLKSLRDSGYSFLTVRDYALAGRASCNRFVILRHDVDLRPEASLRAARMENSLGITGTYFFRITRNSFDAKIIKEIASLGHEVGYHYEDIDLVRCHKDAGINYLGSEGDDETSQPSASSSGPGLKGGEQRASGEVVLASKAFKSFRTNLMLFRKLAPVSSICMHGSPTSRLDGRMLWKYYDYKDLDIVCEPYFDIPLDDMLYLTDTGRRWDGDRFSVRDKVYSIDPGFYKEWVRKPVPGSAMAMTEPGKALAARHRYTRTTEIISAAHSSELPARILLTVHPQRWNDNFLRWSGELILQIIKNRIKALIIKSNRNGI